jgi:hypothetical protein
MIVATILNMSLPVISASNFGARVLGALVILISLNLWQRPDLEAVPDKIVTFTLRTDSTPRMTVGSGVERMIRWAGRAATKGSHPRLVFREWSQEG